MAMIQVPNRKVTVGLVSGSLMTILAWVTQKVTGEPIPAEVALAGATVINFILQYAIPEASQEPTSA